ncbi:MAG TPA: glycosyltransferase 87 family protein [Candidatus Limnocylindrales bacterium]
MRTWGARTLASGVVLIGLLFLAYLFVVLAPMVRTVGFDAYSYWRIDLAQPYALSTGHLGAFPYSPVLARAFAFAAGGLTWPTFWWVWTAILVATAGWLGGRRWWVAVFAFPPVALELYEGNLNLLIAAAIALGFRYPATWSFVLLAKVTPGVGLIWFAIRREWRALGLALAATGILVAVSLAVDAGLWRQWIEQQLLTSLREPTGQAQIAIPLLVRLPVAAALVAWGGLTNRRWTVPLSAALALPVLWVTAFSILAAIPAIYRQELEPGPIAAPSPAPGVVVA